MCLCCRFLSQDLSWSFSSFVETMTLHMAKGDFRESGPSRNKSVSVSRPLSRPPLDEGIMKQIRLYKAVPEQSWWEIIHLNPSNAPNASTCIQAPFDKRERFIWNLLRSALVRSGPHSVFLIRVIDWILPIPGHFTGFADFGLDVEN